MESSYSSFPLCRCNIVLFSSLGGQYVLVSYPTGLVLELLLGKFIFPYRLFKLRSASNRHISLLVVLHLHPAHCRYLKTLPLSQHCIAINRHRVHNVATFAVDVSINRTSSFNRFGRTSRLSSSAIQVIRVPLISVKFPPVQVGRDT